LFRADSSVGVVPAWSTNRTEQDPIGSLAGSKCLVGQGDTVLFDRTSADKMFGELKLVSEQLPDFLKDSYRGLGYFGSDSITGECDYTCFQ
jgi:hypothetical protein